MHDANATLDFKGSVDFREKLPFFDFAASVKNAALSKLKLFNRDSSALFSADADLKMHGLNFDDFNGAIQLKNISYSEEYKTANINSLKIVSIKDLVKDQLNSTLMYLIFR